MTRRADPSGAWMRGFTLIELVVVLAVLALVLGLAVPALPVPSPRVGGSASLDIVSVMREAQGRALREGTRIDVVVDTRGDRYWLLADDGRQIEAGRFDFDTSTRWDGADARVRVSFSGVGMASGTLPPLRLPGGVVEQIAVSRWDGEVWLADAGTVGATP